MVILNFDAIFAKLSQNMTACIWVYHSWSLAETVVDIVVNSDKTPLVFLQAMNVITDHHLWYLAGTFFWWTMVICYYTSSVSLGLSIDSGTLTLAWQTYAIISADYHIIFISYLRDNTNPEQVKISDGGGWNSAKVCLVSTIWLLYSDNSPLSPNLSTAGGLMDNYISLPKAE